MAVAAAPTSTVTSPRGWWVMGDFKYTPDHETDAETFDTELEVGRMLAPDWAVSLRPIESSLDSTRRWGAVVVVRPLF